MNNENVKKELHELVLEKLIKEYIFKDDKSFDIFTLEENVLSIEISLNYCYKIKEEDFLYESFEQMLRIKSEGYTNRFRELMYEKLSKIIQRDDE
jgi:hypothetical protein